MLMEPLESLGPKFLNSDHLLGIGLVTSVKEGRDPEAQALFGNIQNLVWPLPYGYCKGSPTTCNNICCRH
jgi:hypothetical protein